MGIEKQGSKGGNYVGGLLQMFDWNAKSRKKLFSSKSDVPELSKQKKRCEGNSPMTRLHMDVDEIGAGSSIRGSSGYNSCASSVTDEDFYATKAPGVVARLMGLESLPKSNMSEQYSTPLFDSQSLQEAYYRNKSREYFQDQIMHSGNLQKVPLRNDLELLNSRKIIQVQQKPLEKFQTENFPPKSAKSISITHHKLLSPIKNTNFIPSKDAAQIMEAAARIIERGGPRSSTKTKLPLFGSSSSSSSVPLKVRDLKEKVQASQKPLKIFEGGSQRKGEPYMNRSLNESVDSEESSVCKRNKGKSISLALQAKVNVQKREGLNVDRGKLPSKEPCEISPNHVFKSQQQSTPRNNTAKKPSVQNSSSVLRQNNQKQNCIVERGKLPAKKGGKILGGEPSSTRKRNSSKISCTSKAGSRKSSSEVKEEKNEGFSLSRSEKITSKKRSVDGNYHCEKSQIDDNSKGVQSSAIMDKASSWEQNCGKMGTEVISFTFTSPMTGSGRSTEAGENGTICKRTQMNSKFSCIGNSNVRGGDALSTLLEQKLKELARKVEFAQQKSVMQEANKAKDGMHTDYQGVLEEMSTSESNTSQARNLIDYRLPSPISVLEYSSFANSWNSSETGDCNSIGGNKQCSSIQTQDLLDNNTCSLKTFLKDAELSDSASSTVLTLSGSENPKRWELDYVKRILCNIEIMFKDYALGRTREVISPRLFEKLESSQLSRTNQRVLFDCVSECLDLRFRQYVNGGLQLYAKGLSVVRRKDRLAEEVYKEISSWSAVGDSMIDELVDKDMSSRYGKWLDFDIEGFEIGVQIESRILNSLMDEVLDDILVL
ncbi:hypothetical protein ACP275_14G005600 [Erythranthe tilingii]